MKCSDFSLGEYGSLLLAEPLLGKELSFLPLDEIVKLHHFMLEEQGMYLSPGVSKMC